ncbi:class I SAM-dependent methyltransferase [Streptomyces sp. BE230]|uniref:class I SAM-dependent methyltransferase n=1 Tax=Streptomyces sp. BE230 TaxID=3002526 RepID=UPI002ED37E7C|nr:class I SAM-dependent methyltransferase [Streptomyces sp. BE230]
MSGRHAMSFGEMAELYDRIRPSYPEPAVRWALGDRPLDVIDVGAGTGILTRSLAVLGHRCTAVDPDPRMRAVLARNVPGSTVLHGTAEAMPLPDGYGDAVVAAESYHWFDPAAAHPEIARVLRPNGLFAVMWHFRDESVPWVRALTDVLHSYDDTGAHIVPGPEPGAHFGPFGEKQFAFGIEHTRSSLLQLYRSHSFSIAAGPQRRARLERDIGHLVDTHPGLRERDRFVLPYITRVYRTRRTW